MNFTTLTVVVLLFKLNFFYISTEANESFFRDEAFIENYRVKEPQNSGYQPLYLTIDKQNDLMTVSPALPQFTESYRIGIPISPPKTPNEDENEKEDKEKYPKIVYGCNRKEELEPNAFISEIYQNDLQIFKIEEEFHNKHINIHLYRCKTPIFPEVFPINEKETCAVSEFPEKYDFYDIGFSLGEFGKLPLIRFCYNKDRKLVSYSEHTIYGSSLSSSRIDPSPVFASFRDSYSNSNKVKIYEMHSDFIVSYIKKMGGHSIESVDFVPAPLIPEHDMPLESWTVMTQIHYIYIPLWRDVYLNQLLVVEKEIRRAAFYLNEDLKIYSGASGHLNFKQFNAQNGGRTIYLEQSRQTFVPAYVWKIAFRNNTAKNKIEAIAIVIHNKPVIHPNIKDINLMLSPIKPLCSIQSDICRRYGWFKEIQNQSMYEEGNIYCCNVADMTNEIKLPAEVLNASQFYYPKKPGGNGKGELSYAETYFPLPGSSQGPPDEGPVTQVFRK